MDRLNELQSQIFELFIDRFSMYQGGLNLSCPLIPRISGEYLQNRVVLIGQETNTWYRESEDDLTEVFLSNIDQIINTCLINRTDKFIKESVPKYRGKFWEFSRLLYKENIIDGKMVMNGKLSHCWINLFAVESCKNKKDENGRPTKNRRLAEKIVEIQGDLVYQILQILQPQLIIFLTGYRLDEFVLKQIGDQRNQKFERLHHEEILNNSMLGQLTTANRTDFLKGTRIIRTYHPSYFMSRINLYKKLRKKLDSQNIQLSNSKYYIKTLLKELRM